MARKKLGEMLIEAGVLTETSLRAALAEQRRWGGTLGRTLVEMKMLSEENLVSILSQQLAMPTVNLDEMSIPLSVLELVPGELAQQWSLVPFARPMKFLDVAMSDPTNLGITDELRIRTQLNIRPFLAGPKQIERALAKFYGRGFGSYHRSEVAITLDAGDVLEPIEHGATLQLAPTGLTVQPAAGDAPLGGPAPANLTGQPHEGIRPYPRRSSLTSPPPEMRAAPQPVTPAVRDAEVAALQERCSHLEARVQRDEEVLRKLLALLVDKRVATREEILERIR